MKDALTLELELTWSEVKKRDWIKYPDNGLTK